MQGLQELLSARKQAGELRALLPNAEKSLAKLQACIWNLASIAATTGKFHSCPFDALQGDTRQARQAVADAEETYQAAIEDDIGRAGGSSEADKIRERHSKCSAV